MDPAGRRVLITGGTGFLGRHLVQQCLADPKAWVRVLALPHEPVPGSWSGRVDLVRGDITRAGDVDRAMDGCQSVFHLAALVGDGASHAEHERVTVGGTVNVLDAALRKRAKVVLTTSICVYGDRIRIGPCAEDAPMGRHQGPYSRAKQLQERQAWQFHAQGGRITVVRPANIIGPGCGPWVTDACRALRQGLPALIDGGGGNAALAVVDNVAGFLLFVEKHPHAMGRAFNIHDDLPFTWRDYFGDLARMMGAPPPKSIPRWLAYMGAMTTEPLFRALHPKGRPPVTTEALNLIAWNNQFPLDRAWQLDWRPRVGYAQALASIEQDILSRAL